MRAAHPSRFRKCSKAGFAVSRSRSMRRKNSRQLALGRRFVAPQHEACAEERDKKQLSWAPQRSGHACHDCVSERQLWWCDAAGADLDLDSRSLTNWAPRRRARRLNQSRRDRAAEIDERTCAPARGCSKTRQPQAHDKTAATAAQHHKGAQLRESACACDARRRGDCRDAAEPDIRWRRCLLALTGNQFDRAWFGKQRAAARRTGAVHDRDVCSRRFAD